MFRLIITQGILHIFFKSERDQVHLLNLDLDQGIIRVLLLLCKPKGELGIKFGNIISNTQTFTHDYVCKFFVCLK
jgi:hypothetical protein